MHDRLVGAVCEVTAGEADREHTSGVSETQHRQELGSLGILKAGCCCGST